MLGYQALKDDWRENSRFKQFLDLTAVGGKNVAGSLLVIQGATDPIMQPGVTTKAVEETAAASPDGPIHYTLMPGLSHSPVIYSSQFLWFDWIDQRFRNVEMTAGLERVPFAELSRPIDAYQVDTTWNIKTEM